MKYHDPYENVYDALAELNYYQKILELNGKQDSKEYLKIEEYIQYLQDKYLTPKMVNEVYAYRVLPGKISKIQFQEWLINIGREDLLDKYNLSRRKK